MKSNEVPLTGLAGLKAYFKDDIISGFSVSLIALPLCLGIAIASGVPPLAGLIAAIVGGLVASRISGTFVTISGPAAGLIVITLGAVESMNYPSALGAIVIGGAIMTLFGLLKVGKVGDFFPSAAVHGMLAAIGVIIIIKQIYPAIGVASPKGEILEVAAEIPAALMHINSYALMISGLSLAILISHPFIKIKLIKMIPAPMWVLLFTIPAAILIGTENLKMVSMPHNLFGEGGFQLPSFSEISTSAFWVAVIGFSLVSAIETMLSAKAVDSLDPYKRNSNLNQDLISMGVGSSLSAAIGGLPMISEIVRSSANVNNGAKTQWSNFFHGAFLLIYLVIGVAVIEMIPIAALAAMLVFTGFRLASPKEFKHMFQIGLMELEIFIVTLVAVLATDLLVGIAIGILFKYVLILFKGTKIKELFKANMTIEEDVTKTILYLKGSQIFSNYLSLKKKLDSATAKNKELILDFTDVDFVDHTVLSHLDDYARIAKMKGIDVHIENTDSIHPVSNHPLAARDRKAKARIQNIDIEPRTLELLSFAGKKGYQFQNLLTNFDLWQFYRLTIRKQVLKIENIIHKKYQKFEIEIADIHTQTGAMSTESTEEQTVMKISGLKNFPKFYLEPTSILDVLEEQIFEESIKIDGQEDFSNKYKLKSDSEIDAVKKLFSKELIALLMTKDFELFSGNGKDLVISTKGELLSVSKIEKLIDFGEQVIAEL